MSNLCAGCGKPQEDWPNDTDSVRAWIHDDHGYWHNPCWGSNPLKQRIKKLEDAIRPFAQSPLSTEPEAMRTRLFSFEDHDAKIQAARDALEGGLSLARDIISGKKDPQFEVGYDSVLRQFTDIRMELVIWRGDDGIIHMRGPVGFYLSGKNKNNVFHDMGRVLQMILKMNTEIDWVKDD
jgi:hypothetical protein